MRGAWIFGALLLTGVVACAGGPGPGAPGTPDNANGDYTGQLTVQGEQFDASLELQTMSDGRVRGAFLVGAPFEIDGRVEGRMIDDLLRVTITYQSASENGCDGRVEGILDVRQGGDVIEGPVTITDCQDELPGQMAFQR